MSYTTKLEQWKKSNKALRDGVFWDLLKDKRKIIKHLKLNKRPRFVNERALNVSEWKFFHILKH